MRTLIIGKVWPEPASSAAGSRTLALIDAFKTAGWPVHFASAAQFSDYSEQLERPGLTTHRIEVNDSSFDRWIQELDPELVVFDRFMTEEQFGWRVETQCPNARRVLDTSDLHCLRAARREALLQQTPLELFNETALREIASIYRSDLSLIISEVELQILLEQFQVPPAQLCYLPLLAGPPMEKVPAFSEREHFVMIGNYLHEPNWDAVRWCRHEIWPLIRKALPSAELHLYGAYEPDKARQLADLKLGVRCCGRAERSMRTLAQYRVNLAPLRFGAGQKGKVVDGFCAGTPTIATPVAAESMNGPIEWGCPMHDDPSDFAAVAAKVYTDPELWSHIQQQGYEIRAERLDATHWKPVLIEALTRLDPSQRRDCFIGRMLRHHQHRSTEFMSRWIEAKNAKNKFSS
ncbi:MAG: glycosyltransferase [Verrucomicrobiota bacterium]